MGAIVGSIIITVIALVAAIYFYVQDKKRVKHQIE
jgi:hypothetical protein